MKTKLLFSLLFIPLFGTSQINLLYDLPNGSLNPGQGNPENCFIFGNNLFFNSSFNSTDSFLYKTNGTTNGTTLVKYGTGPNDNLVSLNPGWAVRDLGGGNLQLAYTVDQQVSAGSFSTQKLAISNLSENNSVVANLGFVTKGELETVDNKFYFIDNSTQIKQFNIDGTILTVKNFSLSASKLFSFNNKLFITADDGGDEGNELFVYDPITNTTTLVADINQVLTGDFINPNQTFGSDPDDFIVANGKLYFTADSGFGRKLCVYNGTNVSVINNTNEAQEMEILDSGSNIYLIFSANISGTRRLIRVNTSNDAATLLSSNFSNPEGMTSYNGFVYFSGEGASGKELYRTNGISTSTALVLDINSTGDSYPRNFIEYAGHLYFRASDGTTGEELWKVDDSNNVSLVEDFVVGPNNFRPKPLAVLNGKLVMSGIKSGTNEIELYTYEDPSLLTYVPDDNFEQQLINLGYDTVLDDYVPTVNISSVQSLTLDGTSGFGISDFTGLEGFVSLSEIQLFNNLETVLDLSQNPNLEIVSIFDLNLSSLTFSPITNPVLREFYIGLTQINALDFSGYQTLTNVNIQANMSQLNSIDISNTSNSNLILSISNTPSFTTLIANNSTALNTLGIILGSVSTLDLSTCPNLEQLLIPSIGIQSLDLTNNSMLTSVNLQNNQLTSLNMKNGANSILTAFNASNNSSLSCIEVDDETNANAGSGVYSSWIKDVGAVYSEDCSTLSTNDFEFTNLGLYPNPAQSSFEIESSNFIVSKVEIYDTNGRLIKTFNGHQNNYSIEELNGGVYFVSIISKEESIVKKLIKS